MFRCDNCGSGYSVMAATSWDSCPRCLARDGISVPLVFELGWRGDRRRRPADDARRADAARSGKLAAGGTRGAARR